MRVVYFSSYMACSDEGLFFMMFEVEEVIRENAHYCVLCEAAVAKLVLPSGKLLKVACPSEMSIRIGNIYINQILISSFLSTDQIN